MDENSERSTVRCRAQKSHLRSKNYVAVSVDEEEDDSTNRWRKNESSVSFEAARTKRRICSRSWDLDSGGGLVGRDSLEHFGKCFGDATQLSLSELGKHGQGEEVVGAAFGDGQGTRGNS